MTSEERKAWLDGLKVGAEVAVQSRYSLVALKVTRLTPTQFIVGKASRFRRKDGWACGDYGNDSHLIPLDDQLREKICDARDRNAFYMSLDWWRKQTRNLPIATVRKLLAVLAEAEGEEGKENK